MLFCWHAWKPYCDRRATKKDCKPRWGYSWIGVGNPKSSKFDSRSHEVAQFALITSFACKTHKGRRAISWLLSIICCNLCWISKYSKERNHGQNNCKGNQKKKKKEKRINEPKE